MRTRPHVAGPSRARLSILYLADCNLPGHHRRHRCPAGSTGPSRISSRLVYRSTPTSGASDPDWNFLVFRAYVLAAFIVCDPGIHQRFRGSPNGAGKPVRVRRLAKILDHAANREGIVRRYGGMKFILAIGA